MNVSSSHARRCRSTSGNPLRRALLLFVLLLRLLLLLFVVPCQGLVLRTARVVALRLQRRARVVFRRHPLHCQILCRSTRRARG
jgi:hypothetical protein